MLHEPEFLSVENVIQIHANVIDTYGGSHGIRDLGLLESAVATPQASFGGQFLHPSLADMAAAYLFSLINNHTFIDGNKRVGGMTAFVFIEINGCQFSLTNDEMESLCLGVAEGSMDKDAVCRFLAERIEPNHTFAD